MVVVGVALQAPKVRFGVDLEICDDKTVVGKEAGKAAAAILGIIAFAVVKNILREAPRTERGATLAVII